MKKSLFFSALMLGALVLAGCNNAKETPATTTTEMWPAYDSEVGLYGYINRKGDWAIPAQFTAASSYFSCGLAQVELNNRAVFIDKSGKIKTSVSFDHAYEFYYGYAKAELNGKYGLLNSNLEFAIDPVYDGSLSNMTTDGIVTFKADETHYGFLDKNGNVIMKDKKPVYYENAASFRDGYCVVCDDASRYDRKGEERIPTFYLVDTKFSPVISDGTYMQMGNMGKGFVAVRAYTKDKDAKYEYDIYSVKDKKNLTSTKYSELGAFTEDGFAVVATGEYSDKVYGVIDTKGTNVIPTSLDEVDNIYGGYVWARVKNEGFLLEVAKNNRVYTLKNDDDDWERPMSGVHNGLVLIMRTTIDSKGEMEVKYSWIDVKNGNKEVFSWGYDKDSEHRGDLHPAYAPAKKNAKLGGALYLK